VALKSGTIILLLFGSVAGSACAQSLGLNPEHDLPVWMRAWSALGTSADLPRRLEGAGTATSGLVYGAPRIGTFWTAGNPAGLVAGTRDTRSDFFGAWSRQQGDYHRPLDPGATSLAQGAAQAWRGFTPTFAMLGRVSFDRERLEPGSRAVATEPFASSPFITTDTSSAGVRRTRATLEGAAGWRFGRWGVGLTLGYEAREHSSTSSGIIRRIRLATPGGVFGIARTLGSVELGVHARYRHRTEETGVIEKFESGRVYELIGYREVPGLDIVGVSGAYFRQRAENAAAFGASLSGGFGNTRWTVLAEKTRLRERLWKQEVNDPPSDKWSANGWRARAAVQRPLRERLLLTLHANATSYSGSADLALDSAGVVFTADESAFSSEAELRLLPAERGWTGALIVGWTHESRKRQDLTAQLGSNISANTPSVSLDVGHTVGPRLLLSAGLELAAYGPTSTIPDPATAGPVYRYYVAPELDLYASRATPTAFSVLVQYRSGKHGTLWLSGRTERLSSSEATPLSSFTPGGSRSAANITGGITIR
jgi:hypothetical protein